MKQTLRIIAASAFVTALLIKAVPALAEPATPQNVSIVRTADLDLASQAGLAKLHQRLQFAAREVCGAASDVDPVGKNKVRQCRHQVLAAARQKAGLILAAATARRTIEVASAR